MSFERDNALLEKYTDLIDSLSVKVKVEHGEILRIVVADLLQKYKGNVKRNDTKYISAFETVLKFYLTEEEFTEYTKAI